MPPLAVFLPTLRFESEGEGTFFSHGPPEEVPKDHGCQRLEAQLKPSRGSTHAEKRPVLGSWWHKLTWQSPGSFVGR